MTTFAERAQHYIDQVEAMSRNLVDQDPLSRSRAIENFQRVGLYDYLKQSETYAVKHGYPNANLVFDGRSNLYAHGKNFGDNIVVAKLMLDSIDIGSVNPTAYGILLNQTKSSVRIAHGDEEVNIPLSEMESIEATIVGSYFLETGKLQGQIRPSPTSYS